jgi:ATP-dependent DNA helicase DinG
LPASPLADFSAALPAYACERGIDPEMLEAACIRLEFLYGEVAADWPGFAERAGQYEMRQACLLTLLLAQTPEDEDRAGANLAQLEARHRPNAHACNGGQCEHFKSCAFFKARRQAASATLQVANHALVLATLQTDSSLIDAGNTLLVFDEAHHLPAIAADQFSYRARLGLSGKLLTSQRTAALRHGRVLPPPSRPDPVAFAQLITGCAEKLAIFEGYCFDSQLVSEDKAVHRFSQGCTPEALISECQELATLLRATSSVVSGIAAALTEPDEFQSPSEPEEQIRAGVELGVYLSRLGTLDKLFSAWTTHDKVP